MQYILKYYEYLHSSCVSPIEREEMCFPLKWKTNINESAFRICVPLWVEVISIMTKLCKPRDAMVLLVKWRHLATTFIKFTRREARRFICAAGNWHVKRFKVMWVSGSRAAESSCSLCGWGRKKTLSLSTGGVAPIKKGVNGVWDACVFVGSVVSALTALRWGGFAL